METLKKSKIGFRNWISFILIGFAGQLAWSVENMYLNKFIFSFGAENYQTMITWTVVVSAIVACLTTIFMGALSDKIRKRKIFIAGGYIVWGISTLAFGFISNENMAVLFPTLQAAVVSSIMVIVLDGIMTFFGSTSNDAAFNAYITHNVKEENRGKVEGVLSILPLVAMLLVFVVLDQFTVSGDWLIFFAIVGGIAFLVGILSFFLLPKEKEEEKLKESYLQSILVGFKIKTIKENKALYLLLLAYLLYGIGTQIFFPYLIIYFQETLQFQGTDFTIVLGSVLIIGSLLTVVAGILSDKFGKKKFLIPTFIILIIGCLLVYFVQKGQLAFALISGIIMMFGYIFGGSILNALVRDNCPKDKEGIFMGVRILFAVTLPMCFGAPIGEAIVTYCSTETYIGEYGTLQQLPPNLIWLVSVLVLLLVFIPIIIYLIKGKGKKTIDYSKNNGRTYELDDEHKELLKDENYIPLNEHPNPYFKRDKYLILNGYWDFKVSKEDTIPEEYDKKILVPFSPESPMSNVNYMVNIDDIMFYRKRIVLDEEMLEDHLLIHLLAVDQNCSLYVNGMLIKTNESGYLPFSYDIRPLIKSDRVLEIILKITDVTDSSYFSRGKQTVNPKGIWYTSTSGVYQTIYLESCKEQYIKDLVLQGDAKEKKIKGIVKTSHEGPVLLKLNDLEFVVNSNEEFSLELEEVHLWSLDDPFLYDVEVKFYDDVVHSSIGFRTIEIKKKGDINRLYLNGKEVVLKGVLDQGYYYGGNLTPTSVDDYLFDIKKMKELGFNTIRKHIKYEMPIFYYLCDKEGMLTIQDVINGGRSYDFWTVSSPLIIKYKTKNIDLNYSKFKREDEEGRQMYLKEMEYIINLLRQSPSNIVICLFNEGWGQFDSTKVYDLAKNLDYNKLFDTCSGWYDNENSNFLSKHIYFLPIKNYHIKKSNRAYLLSEFGGYSLYLKDHFQGKEPYGYKKFKDSESLTKGYKKLFKKIIKYTTKKDMVGFIYTQLSDVEDEVNGILTFDRKITKINEEIIKNINETIDKRL